MEINRILVPTDFSACADVALERATELAKLTHAEIHVLHAYEVPIPIGVDVPMSLPPEIYDRLRDAAKECIDRGLEVNLDTGLEIERQQFAALFATEDRTIGMESFVENGPGKAQFVGR